MGCLDMEDALSLGFIGRNGAYPANEAGRRADLVLAIGARFDDRSASSWIPGYSWNFPHSKLIHVDLDPAELGRNYPPDLGILADARTFLRQLLAELDRRSPRAGALDSWHADIRKWKADWEAFTGPNFDLHAAPIRPERVLADCQAVLPADAILACDVGVSHNWYMQFWKARAPQTMLNSWGFSGMGFGAAGVLGAKLAAPDRPCVAVTGDGCFTMVPHVLCTAAEYDIPVVWVIWNNFAWASIRDIQIGMFGGRELGTAFYQGANKTPYNPDFAAWARASGVEALTVAKSEDFKGALEHAVKSTSRSCSTSTSTPRCGRPPPAPGSCRRRPTRSRPSASAGPRRIRCRRSDDWLDIIRLSSPHTRERQQVAPISRIAHNARNSRSGIQPGLTRTGGSFKWRNAIRRTAPAVAKAMAGLLIYPPKLQRRRAPAGTRRAGFCLGAPRRVSKLRTVMSSRSRGRLAERVAPPVRMRRPIRPHVGADQSASRADHARAKRPDRRLVGQPIGAQRCAVMAPA